MNMVNTNGFLTLEYLSNIELYYTAPENISAEYVKITDDEAHHIVKVMRHQQGDALHVTNGTGDIYFVSLEEAERDSVIALIKNKFSYPNPHINKFFCIPRLKNPERFEFALEKSVELGITNFVVFESKRTIAKGAKIDRWNKILLSAMKQSLRSYLPGVTYAKSVKEILKLEGEKIVFEQNSKQNLTEKVFDPQKKYYFIFGPEGGLDESELSLFNEDEIYELGTNRLRSETAIIKTAAIIS